LSGRLNRCVRGSRHRLVGQSARGNQAGRRFVVHVLDHGHDGLDPGQARRMQPPLAGHHFEAARTQWPHQDRLQHAQSLDGLHERLQAVRFCATTGDVHVHVTHGNRPNGGPLSI
jgi:hypothetical protein